MFPSQAKEFRQEALLGTNRTGKDDKFDPDHPIYRVIRALSGLRESRPGLSRGAMLLRPSGSPNVFAFSRIEHSERVEYLVAANSSRSTAVRVNLQTCQPPSATLRLLFDSKATDTPQATSVLVNAGGVVSFELAPLQLVVWQANSPLDTAPAAPVVRFAGLSPGAMLSFTAEDYDGQVIPKRYELRAETPGSDGFAEVTFALKRESRPEQYELIGTADRPPFRVFWRPPADLAPGETLSFVAAIDDLRGHRSATEVGGVKVAPNKIGFGIRGATVPVITLKIGSVSRAKAGADLDLRIEATGTPPLEFGWLHDGHAVPGAEDPLLHLGSLTEADSGRYTATVHNREGTAISRDFMVTVEP